MAEWITNLDFSVLYWMQGNLRCDFLDAFCAFLSVVFDSGILWLIVALLMAFFRKTRASALSLFFSLFIAFLVGELFLKNVIMRERPCTLDPSVPLAIDFPSTFSFPSGHTGSSFAAAFGIFFFQKKIGIPALAVAALVGLSRIYLFVHFPTDVIGGMLLGFLSAFLVFKIMKRFEVDRKLESLPRVR